MHPLMNDFCQVVQGMLERARKKDMPYSPFVMVFTNEEIVDAVKAMRTLQRKLSEKEEWVIHQYINFLEKRLGQRNDRLGIW